MNFAFSNNSMQTTLQVVAKNRAQTISQTLTADFKRMGYGVAGSQVTDVITTLEDSTKISFEADLDNDGTPESITWHYQVNTKYTASANPDDYVLTRTVGSETYTYPAVSFKFTFYDSGYNPTSTIADVSRIGVEVVCESSEAISTGNGQEQYGRAFWQRTIIPPSIHIRQLQS
jgi:hypothetical protein